MSRCCGRMRGISIHAPLAGCDQRCQGGRIGGGDFNPRTPCGVRRVRVGHFLRRDAISIHAPLAGCDPRGLLDLLVAVISIHAPLAGCDRAKMDAGQEDDISIHAPLAGCDDRFRHPLCPQLDFNPRTPCGVRPWSTAVIRINYYFNPRTPCGVRLPAPVWCTPPRVFQSTHPLRGATQIETDKANAGKFQSTHPLRGATARFRNNRPAGRHFNPRTPCGVRPGRGRLCRRREDFNPRTPCGVRQCLLERL